MASSSYYYYPTYTAPVAMPTKQPAYYPTAPYNAHSRLSVSPPETAASSTTGGASYDPSGTASSYAGSASDYESTTSAGSVDLLEYMGDRLNGAFNPIPLDRSLAVQAQTSGQLNAKTRQLLELQALAQQRMAAVQMDFASGMKAAKEVQRDLQWTQKRVTALNQRAAKKYPKEYAVAQERYPAPMDY